MPPQVRGGSWLCENDSARRAYAFLQYRRLTKARRKKESTGHRLNQAYRPCDTPSSSSWLDCRLSDARTADDGSVPSRRMNKSATVVLVGAAEIPKQTTDERAAANQCDPMK